MLLHKLKSCYFPHAKCLLIEIYGHFFPGPSPAHHPKISDACSNVSLACNSVVGIAHDYSTNSLCGPVFL